MEISGEKINFQLPDFGSNVMSAFGRLRQDIEFTDVTLVCEDGKQVDAHKLVLISSSPFFMKVLTKNNHPNLMIYMRGVKSENLLSMMDFLYNGEANVLLENYDSFLSLAEDLQLKGLSESILEVESASTGAAGEAVEKIPRKLDLVPDDPTPGRQTQTKVEDQDIDGSSALEVLDQKVKGMMMFSSGPCAYGRRPGRARVCKVCGIKHVLFISSFYLSIDLQGKWKACRI